MLLPCPVRDTFVTADALIVSSDTAIASTRISASARELKIFFMLDFLSVRINSFLAVKPMQPRNSSASALGLLCHSKSCCKQQIPASHHRYTTASCAPARRDVDRVFCPLVRSFLRVASPGQYALMLWLFSCRCDSSFRDGRRPGRFVLRSPGSAFPIRNRGFLRVGGDALAVGSRG